MQQMPSTVHPMCLQARALHAVVESLVLRKDSSPCFEILDLCSFCCRAQLKLIASCLFYSLEMKHSVSETGICVYKIMTI